MFVNVLNRSEKMDIATRIESVTGRMDGAVDVWELNHPDLKATHTFGDDRKVRPSMRNFNAQGNGASFFYTFPRHSLTILKIKVLS